MRWVHLPSAYTPLWIALTLPAYLFGFQLFLLILWNMKLLVAGFYLFFRLVCGRDTEAIGQKQCRLGYGNTCVKSPYYYRKFGECTQRYCHDGVCTARHISFYQEKYWSAWFVLALSIALKLMTIFLVPLALVKWRRGFALAGMSLGLILVLTRREFLPWYFVWVLPFVALMPTATLLLVISSGLSLGLLLQYAPYLYLGHWNTPVPFIKIAVTVIAPAVFFGVSMFFRIAKKLCGRPRVSAIIRRYVFREI